MRRHHGWRQRVWPGADGSKHELAAVCVHMDNDFETTASDDQRAAVGRTTDDRNADERGREATGRAVGLLPLVPRGREQLSRVDARIQASSRSVPDIGADTPSECGS